MSSYLWLDGKVFGGKDVFSSMVTDRNIMPSIRWEKGGKTDKNTPRGRKIPISSGM